MFSSGSTETHPTHEEILRGRDNNYNYTSGNIPDMSYTSSSQSIADQSIYNQSGSGNYNVNNIHPNATSNPDLSIISNTFSGNYKWRPDFTPRSVDVFVLTLIPSLLLDTVGGGEVIQASELAQASKAGNVIEKSAPLASKIVSKAKSAIKNGVKKVIKKLKKISKRGSKGTPKLTEPDAGDNIGVNLHPKVSGNASKGWKVGDPINNLTRGGKYPSWNTVRSRYWKNVANAAEDGEYSAQDIARMKKGRAPQHPKLGVSKELHHINGRNIPDPHNINNLQQVWPWEHADIDPFRNYNGPRP